jgi:8-oxo-dGTP diphosphatase
MPKPLPKLQRVAAYALVLRGDQILLTRLASRISADEKWHLPGGGVDHGEDPRDAVVREIREETGLEAEVGDTARIYSAHLPSMWRKGRRWDYQALRIVYDAWVPVDAPAPRVVDPPRWRARPRRAAARGAGARGA